MALETTTNVTIFIGNGATTVWPLGYKFWQHDEIEVTHVDLAGVETLLELDTDYTVDGGDNKTGSITYPITGSPLPGDGTEENSERLIARRVLDIEQLTRLRNQGPYFPEIVEVALDKMTARLQQLDEELGRAVKQALSSGSGADLTFPPYAPNEVLGWDETTPQLRNYSLAQLPVLEVSAWGQAWVNLPGSNNGRLVLGANQTIMLPRAPTANDDAANGGHQVGDLWFDVTNPTIPVLYTCIDETEAAAVWLPFYRFLTEVRTYDYQGFIQGEAQNAGVQFRATVPRPITLSPAPGGGLLAGLAPGGGDWGLKVAAFNGSSVEDLCRAVLLDGQLSKGWTAIAGAAINVPAGGEVRVDIDSVTAGTLPQDIGWSFEGLIT